MKGKHNIDLDAGFSQLKTRIERRQHNLKLRIIWWAVILAAMSVAVASYVQNWF